MLSVQVTKDTFYQSLRDRIAAGNPARTFVSRGLIRPGILVVENEISGAAVDKTSLAEVFCLRWTDLAVDIRASNPMVKLTCEIRYASDGSPGAGGLDRGRTLATMDAELAAALIVTPMNASAVKVAETAGGGAVTETPTGSNVFWTGALFAPQTMRGERLERIAHVEVFGYGD